MSVKYIFCDRRCRELKKFLRAELNSINRSKYIESEKAHRDLSLDEYGRPSQRFYIGWIRDHAADFRKAWKKSLCRTCTKAWECNECVKTDCSNYTPETTITEAMKKVFFLIHE